MRFRVLSLLLAIALSCGVVVLPPPAQAVEPEPPSIDPACWDATRGRFSDVSGTHARAIDCIGWWGVTQGAGSGAYLPAGGVTRGQLATFLARTLKLAGVPLPAPTATFTDTAGTPHDAAISQLAQLGVVRGVTSTQFRPEATVTRAQMASFIAASWKVAAGTDLPPGSSRFTDTAGSTHAANIDRVAAAGLAAGTSASTYGPDAKVTRAQMATFLSRMLAKLVTTGHLRYPPASPAAMPPSTVRGVVVGSACSRLGAIGTSATGTRVTCRALWGERLWQPELDAVALRAYAKLNRWLVELPTASSPAIARYPSVPVTYEREVAKVVAAGTGIYAGTGSRHTFVLLPLGDPAAMAWARRLVVDSLPADTTEAERAGVTQAFESLLSGACGGASLQGRTKTRPMGFAIIVFPVTPIKGCGPVMTPTEVAEGVTREWLADRPSGSGLDSDPWPCWAGEAGGWPLQRMLMDRLGTQQLDRSWARWTVQLARPHDPPFELGLAKSYAWTLGPGQYCKLVPGVGHIQGTLAHELLIDRYGVETWLAWGERAWGVGARQAFQETFGITLGQFMVESDRRTLRLLGRS
jgi:hypothetical protein